MRRNLNQQTHVKGSSRGESSNEQAEGSGNHTEEAQPPNNPISGTQTVTAVVTQGPDGAKRR
jgi:hypothetical protein